MKPKQSVAIATWMLKHFTLGPRNEALLGDLLEEFRGGRSAGWYWRQSVCAIGVSLFSKSRDYALPLAFSLVWSMFYPVCWLCIVKLPQVQTNLERWAAIDWPYSTALRGVGEAVPAIAFVWLGLFVYLLPRPEIVHRLSRLQLFASLSISLNVLLMTTIGLWMHLKPGMSYVARENSSFNSHLLAISIPLASSLFSAISFAFSRAQRRRHGVASVPS